MCVFVCACVYTEKTESQNKMNSKRAATTTKAEAATATAATAAETVSVVLCVCLCVCVLCPCSGCCSPSHLDGSPQSVRSMCFSAAAGATSTAAVVLLRAAARVDVCVCVACVPFNRCRSSAECVCGAAHVACGMRHVSLSVCRCFDCVSLPRLASPHLALPFIHSFIHFESREAANKKQQQKNTTTTRAFACALKRVGGRERVCECGQKRDCLTMAAIGLLSLTLELHRNLFSDGTNF